MTTLRNAAANIAGYAVSLAIGLFFTPYIIGKLGVVSYGIVPLVMSLFVWGTWISLAVNWSVGRFVTIAHVSGDAGGTAVIFNTSMVASIVLGAGLIVGGFTLAPFAGSLLRLPPGTERAAGALIIMGSVSTAFGVLSGVAEVAFYCLNRFDLRAVIQIVRSLTTVGLVLVLFRIGGPRIEWVGLGSCGAAVAAAMAAYVWGRKLLPQLIFRPRLFSLSSLRTMMATNTWIVVDQLGTILLLNLSLFLVNQFCGPVASAEYALAAQWQGMLASIMASITVFTPQYVVQVARSDQPALQALCLQASRFVSIVTGICGGILIGLAGWLPEVWLHRPTTMVGPLIVGMVALVVVNAAANPLYGVWHALNRVRTPSFVTLASGLVGLLLSLLLLWFTSLGPWAVLVGSGLAFTLRNTLFTFRYVSHLISIRQAPLIKSAAAGITTCGLVGFAAFLIARWVDPKNWFSVVGVTGMTVCLTLPILLFTLVSRSERSLVLSRVRRYAGFTAIREKVANLGTWGLK